jgi:succinate dehydrogenase / fumarate reductase cytochrome b subunit
MSATTTRPDSSYLLRKLHSLSGLVPVGAFLAEHFWSNSAVLVSPEKYNSVSQELQTIPFRPFVELFAIVLPILFHGGYGVYIWWSGKSNVSQYPWIKNWLYTLQRYTGLIALAYIGWHLYTERWLTHGKSTYLTVYNDLRNPLYMTFAVGILASSSISVSASEFSLQWGQRPPPEHSALPGNSAGCRFWFSLVGILILISFRLIGIPFSNLTR